MHHKIKTKKQPCTISTRRGRDDITKNIPVDLNDTVDGTEHDPDHLDSLAQAGTADPFGAIETSCGRRIGNLPHRTFG
jgi:hypothetical protein